jgi:hypothetical protein
LTKTTLFVVDKFIDSYVIDAIDELLEKTDNYRCCDYDYENVNGLLFVLFFVYEYFFVEYFVF